ncbi:ABC transporter substrate-binding protein [Pseudonocardia phyllosphaerae]|uniref:ABC transporter substrate-binding protein n=1 Tax=Pseudonocardia phyllosphaerae TaxID=3390502 RepID=UPI003979E297
MPAAVAACIALLGVSVLLAGCGGASAPASSSQAPQASGAGFPVTVRHAFGETTIPAKPQRVVVLGLNDLAVAQKVGAPVVGAVRNVTGPAALPYLPPLPDDVAGLTLGDVGAEKVAAYRPDLILAVGFPQMDQAMFDRLSEIAPVVTYARSLYGDSMQDDARQVGRALGETEKVEKLIADADHRVAQLRTELPGLAGKTYLFGQARGQVLPMVVGEQNQSTVFMRSLGLSVPPSFRDAPASDALAPGTVGLSYEEAGRLSEADLLLITFARPDDRALFEQNPLVKTTRPVRQGTFTPLTLDQAVALQAPNVVGASWLLDQLRPSLERVAGR